MAVETNARIEFSVASVEEWEKVNPKLHQGEPVFAKKPSGKYILKVGAPDGSTYKNAVVVWDQDDAETKMTSTQEAAAQALASKNAASASASAAKAIENAAAASKSAAATSEANAKTSETNAAASKTAAANSASTASAKATAAANSSSAAATSEKNAQKSASAASTSSGNAKVSETNAAASASAAAQSASAAAKSAIDAAKFDPSSYYLKSEVDNKIGAVWDEPLNWDELENRTAVQEGRLIVYDTFGNPWLLECGFLQYLINNALDLSAYALKTAIPTKTSQLTNDSGFANTAALESEAKKWKAAYNSLRKRSYPTVFDDNELTVLIDTPIKNGPITLSQPYTDFDGLFIDHTSDEKWEYDSTYISSAEITRRKEECINTGNPAFSLFNGKHYWYVGVTSKFSPTFLPQNAENCMIQRIYGVKFKEIT